VGSNFPLLGLYRDALVEICDIVPGGVQYVMGGSLGGNMTLWLAAEPMFTAGDWERLVAEHQPPNVLLVADDASEGVVGFVAVHPEDGEMFLLFVHPDHAGRGMARTLLAAAHDALRAAGCREAFLFVHEQNERAIAVYAAAGYRPDGSDRVSDFRGVRIRELRLVKPL
jgi:GNAT superfamily N-acetyltransferase